MKIIGQEVTDKTQKTFMFYIKPASEEIADEIAAMSRKDSKMWCLHSLLFEKTGINVNFLK